MTAEWPILQSSPITVSLWTNAIDSSVPNAGVDANWYVSPRVGFAWDVAGDSRWKLYGSYGVYYDVTKYEMPRGSFGGDKWVDYWFTFDIANPGLNDPAAGCTVGNNTIFDVPTCGAGTLYDTVDQRFNSIDPLFESIFGFPAVDPDIKPMENWEAQIGFDLPPAPRGMPQSPLAPTLPAPLPPCSPAPIKTAA